MLPLLSHCCLLYAAIFGHLEILPWQGTSVSCILICAISFLDTRYIKMFILDEADEMLSRGFKDQIYDVFRTLNESIQVSREEQNYSV